MHKRPLFFFAIASFLFHCATLSPLPADTCGNGVVDPGEDCDGFATACGHSFATGIAASIDNCSLACNASGQANACHYACDGSHPCLDGWGCSADGVCRRPSGAFASAGDAISSGVDTLASGDFDGDRRKDILSIGAHGPENSARARVLYFNASGQLDQTFQFAAPLSSPTVRDLDGDGIDDILFGVRTSFSVAKSDFSTGGAPGGFAATTGQRARGFVPAVFPSFTIPDGADGVPILAFPTLADATFQTFVVGRVHDKNGAIVNAVTAYNASGIAYQHVLPADAAITFAAWAGLVAPVEAKDDACGDIFVAYTSAAGSAVNILSPCRYANGATTFTTDDTYLTFNPALDATNGIHLADLDGVGAPEIIYLAPGKAGVHAARLTGNSYKTEVLPLPALVKDVPLASGDVNADGHVDFVMPDSIILSQDKEATDGGSGVDAGGLGVGSGGLGTKYGTIHTERASNWKAARIAPIDGDSIPDVVAFVDGQPDVDFYAGGQGVALVHSTISTDGAVTKLATVDIDGDHLFDVAFASQRDGTTEIDVAYGRAFGPPETPRIVGRIGGITSLEPLFSGTPNGLTIFTSQGDGGKGLPNGQIAVLSGDGDRQPIAPILFSGADRWQPLLVAGGKMVPGGTGIDFLGLADLDQDTARSIWLAPGRPLTPTGDLTSLGARMLSKLPGGFSRVQSFSLAVNGLDGDALDDLAILVPSTPPVVTVSLLGPSTNSTIALPSGAALHARSIISLDDLDGDGFRDVMATMNVDGKGRIVVMFGHGNGTFDSVVVLPVEDAIAATPVVTGAGPRKRPLAVLTPTGLFLVDVVRDGSATPTKLAATFTAATSIVAADVDGDGVDDLAVADNGSLRLVKQTQFGVAP